jgi:hypothetical protein
MKYGIYVLGEVLEAHTWKYLNKEEAMETAKYLSEKHKVNIIVFEIIGQYTIESSWTPA